MRHARARRPRPETFQRIARRLSSNRAPESSREVARAVTMADLIEVRDRSSVSSAAARLPPARARAVGVYLFRASFPHTTHRSCTAADQGRQRRQGGGGGTRRGAPRCGGGVRRARRHQGTGGGGEAQGTEEEGGGCQPADGARPGASPFSPHPASRRSRPRRGGRCPPSFGAHDTTRDVRDVPGASRAHLDVRA